MKFSSLPLVFVQAALVATATILAFILVTKYVSPIPLSITQTTTQKDTAFNISGKSTITTIPDKVEISLGISRKASDLKQAQSDANAIINTITQKLKELGISANDIKTQNYSIYPNYDYQKSGQNIVGYSVDITLTISTKDLEKLNQIVDLSTASGANTISGIRFTLSDEKENELKKQARSQAIQDAQSNAQQLSSLAGMRLGRIINIVEGQAAPPQPIYYADKAMATGMGGGGGNTNISTGSTTYTYTVTLSYETL